MQIFIAEINLLLNSNKNLPITAADDYREDKFSVVTLCLTHFSILIPFLTHLFHAVLPYSTSCTVFLTLPWVGTEWVEMKISFTSVCLASQHSQAVFLILVFQGQFYPLGADWISMEEVPAELIIEERKEKIKFTCVDQVAEEDNSMSNKGYFRS